MENIILHIGLHKTGTSSLQRHYFPACKNLNLLTTRIPEVYEFIHMITKKDPIYFDKKIAYELIRNKLSHEYPTLISNEMLSGPPYSGVIEAGLDHRSPIILNLRNVFPNAKVIIVLRRQDGLARSFYRQYLKSGGTKRIRRFYGMEGKHRLPLMSRDRFLFLPYIDLIKSSFPSGVSIMLFEEMVADQATFLSKIINFIGVANPAIALEKENVTAFGPFGLEVCRIMNYLFRNMLNPGGIIPGIPRRQNDRHKFISPMELIHDIWPRRLFSRTRGQIYEVGNEILKQAREDNINLDKKYNLGLGKYGYY